MQARKRPDPKHPAQFINLRSSIKRR